MSSFDAQTNDPRAAGWRLHALTYLGHPLQTELMDQLLESDGWVLDYSGSYSVGMGAGSVGINMYCALSGGDMFMFLGGLTDDRGARNVWDGYIGSRFSSSTDEPNPVFLSAMQSALSVIPLPVNILTERLHVVGYSAGGAVAILMPALQTAFEFRPRMHITTFGSPRPAGRRVVDLNSGQDICRWFNSDDVVPWIPPELSNWTFYWTYGYNFNQVARVNSYWQGHGGVEIALDGTLTTRGSPSQVDLNLVRAMETWMAAAAANRENSHSLTAYIGRIRAAVSQLPSEGYTPDTSAGGTGGGGESPREIERILSQQQTIFTAGHGTGGSGAVTIPTAQQFRAFRKGRVWYVSFGDRIIAGGFKKRGARQLANRGNSMLRSLQNRGAVQPEALAEQWRLYLEAATDPASGFDPQLNTF
jgi:hypothetical protein